MERYASGALAWLFIRRQKHFARRLSGKPGSWHSAGRPKSDSEAFGLVVPRFESVGYGCISASDTEAGVLDQARDAILSMAEQLSDDGVPLDELAVCFVDYSQHPELDYVDYWVGLDVDLFGIGRQQRLNISLSGGLIVRMDAFIESHLSIVIEVISCRLQLTMRCGNPNDISPAMPSFAFWCCIVLFSKIKGKRTYGSIWRTNNISGWHGVVPDRYFLFVSAFKKRRHIISSAKQEGEAMLSEYKAESDTMVQAAKNKKLKILSEAEQGIIPFEERIERLGLADKEIRSRLKQFRNIIENITDKSSAHAAGIELLSEENLLTSQSYQDDRKKVRSELKKLAVNAIDGVRSTNSDVNVGKFVAISANADMAGALLLTTVEMLCSKVTANNGHQALEKLAESMIAAEALIKFFDSRAKLNQEFRELLVKRLEIEIHYKKARQLAKEEQRELRDKERKEKKAHQKFERAKSRVQETKQGHVDIISNIGSFGKDVLKIGMTRRLDPMDRVKELGDASVPFAFDVHAFIESDNAPNLESILHNVFDHRRVNKVSRRKEYFNVSLDEIEKELERLDINVSLNKTVGADEYCQTLKVNETLAEDAPDVVSA